MLDKFDVVIIGGGIAGLFTALKLSEKLSIAVLTKEKVDISNSILAQGGIAVPLGEKDSPKLHLDDTLYAGAGLCNEEAVWVLVNEAVSCIRELCELGVSFDKDEEDELALTREAAHSIDRIIHAGDSTGKEVCDRLTHIAVGKKNIKIIECTTALELMMDDGKCVGVVAANNMTGEVKQYLTNATICGTGGYGQLYKYTTNPEVATGDGLAMAYNVGAIIMDLEFVQFHPTVLTHPLDNSFLISEAVRGEGAILRNSKGERFMPEYHELAELAPRDVVSRAIFDQMLKWDEDNVWLDITFKDSGWIRKRFPTIYSTCLKYGIDITTDYIPVAPAAHYCMGGIKTDVDAHTSIKGFYACGEVSCTGIHGANRLASNSLLEGLVFGKRIALELNDSLIPGEFKENNISSVDLLRLTVDRDKNVDAIIKKLKSIMIKKVGIIRKESSLLKAADLVEELYEEAQELNQNSIAIVELKNMLLIARLVIKAALLRTESRGAHFRSDYPDTNDKEWQRSILWRKDHDYELSTN